METTPDSLHLEVSELELFLMCPRVRSLNYLVSAKPNSQSGDQVLPTVRRQNKDCGEHRGVYLVASVKDDEISAW